MPSVQTKSACLALEPTETRLVVKRKGWILTQQDLWLNGVWEGKTISKQVYKWTIQQHQIYNSNFILTALWSLQEDKGDRFLK